MTNITLGAGHPKITNAHALSCSQILLQGRECDGQLTAIPDPVAMLFHTVI